MAKDRHTYRVRVILETIVTVRTHDSKRAEDLAQREVMEAVDLADYDLTAVATRARATP